MTKKTALTSFILCLVLLLGTACKHTNRAEMSDLSNKKATVKVLCFDKAFFMRVFGGQLSHLFPNVTFQYVATPPPSGNEAENEKSILDLIENEQPDILYVLTSTVPSLSAFGQLVPLDPLIKRDHYDVDSMYTTGMVRDLGSGTLYGLAPMFDSYALFYNKDIFDRFGVTYPHDQMSWDELIQLTERFPSSSNDQPLKALSTTFYATDMAGLVENLGITYGLSLANPDTMEMTLKSDSWKHVFELAATAYQKKLLFNSDPSSTNGIAAGQDPFLKGESAMGLYSLNEVNALKYKPDIHWNTTTVPVDPRNPNAGGNYSVPHIFAINNRTQNLDLSWDILKFLNSSQAAGAISNSTIFLPARLSVVPKRTDFHFDAFSVLKPTGDHYTQWKRMLLGFQFTPTFYKLLDQQIKLISEGKQTVDQALDILQNEGQNELLNAKQSKG